LPIVLYRVDERLIHGQVVIGWGHELRPTRFLLVDDELAQSGWEQELYRLGAGDTEVVFASVSEARDRIAEWRTQAERSILLTRDVSTMRQLAEGGLLEGEEINLGGLHPREDRMKVLSYLHLTEVDRRELRELESEGVRVSARDLPDAQRVTLNALLDT